LQAPVPILAPTNTWVSITAHMANGIKNATTCARLTWCLNPSTADRTSYSQRTFKAEEELMERLGWPRAAALQRLPQVGAPA
jgi:hypothetical protein